ncbi:MAG: hypothetical protein ACRDVZ_02690 [Jiangellaceae bacterium]
MNNSTDLIVRAAAPEDADTLLTVVEEIADHQGQAESVTVDEPRWRELLAHADVSILLAEIGRRPVGNVSAVRRLHLWPGVTCSPSTASTHGLAAVVRGSDSADDRVVLTSGRHGHHLGCSARSPRRDSVHERSGATVRPKVICAWPAS